MYVYDSSLTLTHCTIAGNSTIILGGGGVYGGGGSSMTLTNCIAWGNAGGSWTISENVPQEDIAVTFSCIESEHVWPGVGNINSDPLFCGYPGPVETFVDAARAENGDGTQERPFRDLRTALEYSLSLKSNSPCIGTARDGANMGADLGVCVAGEPVTFMVHVARGIYSMAGVSLVHGASILGAGADETVLEGTVWGLRSGATTTAAVSSPRTSRPR